MITNLVTLAAVAFGLTFAGDDSSLAKQTCCAKRAYCCSIQARCCGSSSAKVELSAVMAEANMQVASKQSCCVKRAYCCTIKRPCCGKSAKADVKRMESKAANLASSNQVARQTCCAKRAYCCKIKRPCCGRTSTRIIA